jgi:hypothetical protein
MAGFESCNKCKFDSKSSHEFPCCECIHNAREHFSPHTNYTFIRNMSTEEMALWLYNHDTITAEKGRLSREQLLEWLKSEAKE